MEVQVRKITGNWDRGYVLHKHVLSSVFIGDGPTGHPMFDTTRSEPGEALYKLKYQRDLKQVAPLAAQLAESLLPLFGKVGLIVPMPPSTMRQRQPVSEIAKELGRIAGIPVFEKIIVKSAGPSDGKALKDLTQKEEKAAALAGRFSIHDEIKNDGRWNALLLDDLFDTGASMEAACTALRTYGKIGEVYAAAITWK